MDTIQFSYTITQAAAILGRSAKTVRGMIERQELRANATGAGEKRRHYTVPPDAIDEFRRKQDVAVIQRANDVIYHQTRRQVSPSPSIPLFSRYADRAAAAQGR